MAQNKLHLGSSERPRDLRKRGPSTSTQTNTCLRPWLACDQGRKCFDPQQQKKIECDFGVVSWDHHVYSFLLEGNYSLIQFMTQNAPNPLINAFSPPSAFQLCWPNKWWLFLPGRWHGC